MSYTIKTVIPSSATFYVMGDASNPAEIEAAGTATLKFNADGVFYILKNTTVEVTGATKVSWTAAAPYTDGELVISDPTENVVITITPTAGITPQKMTIPFSYSGKAALDIRTVLSKAQMPLVKDAQMPEVYFAICKDDSKIYVYTKSAEKLADTGKFREISDSISFESPEAKENFENAVINSETIINLKEEIEELSVDGGEVQGD